MAWLITSRPNQTAVPAFETVPAAINLRVPREYFEKRGLRPGLGLQDRAIEIEDRFWPRKAYLERQRKKLPHAIGFAGFHAMSEDMRACVEEFEPGVHDFKHVPIYNRDNTLFPIKYYALNVRQKIDDYVDFEKTTAHVKEYDHLGKKTFADRFSDEHIVYVKSQDRYHMWIAPQINGGKFTLSNELHQMIKDRRLLWMLDSIHLYEPGEQP